MKYNGKLSALAIIIAIASLSACSNEAAVEAEIKVPVLEGGSTINYNTATVEIKDIEETQNVGGSIGYAYADTLYIDFKSNVVEYVAERNQSLKKGDPIAIFDSSALDYDYQNQKILADDAYAKYLSTGSQAARLEYEIQAKELELLEYKIDQYTVRAPYDCIITSLDTLAPGAEVKPGTKVCTIAREGEVYIYTGKSTELFQVGMTVEAKFGSDGYKGRVVMIPEERKSRGDGGGKDINRNVIIKLEEGELERLVEEVDNVVSAGWATIIVPTVQKYNVMTLPEEAVATFSGSTYCSVMNNGMQVRIPVEVEGVYNGLAVIRSGLEEGDEVIY